MGQHWDLPQLPDQRGRTAVVTGANSGIGRQVATVLAGRGAHVVLAVRDTGKGEQAAAAIRARHPQAEVSVQCLDLADLESVRRAAEQLTERFPEIDLLVNNAGICQVERITTVDGHEGHFGVNHLGHFALTARLLGALERRPGSRVVTVGSLLHRYTRPLDFEDLQSERSFRLLRAYGRSKQAALLFTHELNARLAASRKPTIAVAAHPGSARTDIARSAPFGLAGAYRSVLGTLVAQSVEQGALPVLRAATDHAVRGGEFYGPRGPGQVRGRPRPVPVPSRYADPEQRRRLWEASEELTGVSFPI